MIGFMRIRGLCKWGLIGLFICFFTAMSANAQLLDDENDWKAPKPKSPKTEKPKKQNTTYTTLPIRLPLAMSGDFAEIRPNHFHSGLDIRTEGEEGKPIYAPNDGYVSRINISAWGGGKVLYITHPDGYRTVYMHLSAFCGKIGEFVNDYQYSHQCYAFDTELPRDSIKVKKGDLVALSGNSGGSMGPHLHYEIRIAENDQTINPLHFGLPYSDPIAPTIAGIKIYPASNSTTINGRDRELKVYPKTQSSKNKDTKSNSKNDTIAVAGRFYTGIYTYDQMERGSLSKNGVERIELYVDDTLFQSYSVASFLFEETRAINALIDYREYQRSREYYILSRRLRGDPTNFNSVSRNYGYLQFDDGKVHRLQYRVYDYKGNRSNKSFYVRGIAVDKQSNTPKKTKSDNLTIQQSENLAITYYKPFHLVREGFAISVDANNLYENDQMAYHTSADPCSITKQHHISPIRNPLPPHDRIRINLTIPDKVPSSLRSKLVVVCVNGKKVSACPSSKPSNNQTISATSRTWGAFALRLDTLPPTIQQSGFTDNKTIRGDKLTVVIGDNLSGVEHYSCTVNGEWHVVEHDGKSSSLILDTKHLKKGKNTICFTLTDAVGNKTTKTFEVFR